jgi:hypothetical protein
MLNEIHKKFSNFSSENFHPKWLFNRITRWSSFEFPQNFLQSFCIILKNLFRLFKKLSWYFILNFPMKPLLNIWLELLKLPKYFNKIFPDSKNFPHDLKSKILGNHLRFNVRIYCIGKFFIISLSNSLWFRFDWNSSDYSIFKSLV